MNCLLLDRMSVSAAAKAEGRNSLGEGGEGKSTLLLIVILSPFAWLRPEPAGPSSRVALDGGNYSLMCLKWSSPPRR